METQKIIELPTGDRVYDRRSYPALRDFVTASIDFIQLATLTHPNLQMVKQESENVVATRRKLHRDHKEKADELMVKTLYYTGRNDQGFSFEHPSQQWLQWSSARRKVRIAFNNSFYDPRGSLEARGTGRTVLEILAMSYITSRIDFDENNQRHVNELGDYLAELLSYSDRGELRNIHGAEEVISRLILQRPLQQIKPIAA